jgi:hypothetical protein
MGGGCSIALWESGRWERVDSGIYNHGIRFKKPTGNDDLKLKNLFHNRKDNSKDLILRLHNTNWSQKALKANGTSDIIQLLDVKPLTPISNVTFLC